MGFTAKRLSSLLLHCKNAFSSLAELRPELLNIFVAGLEEAVGSAMREGILEVMVVVSKDAEDECCTI